MRAENLDQGCRQVGMERTHVVLAVKEDRPVPTFPDVQCRQTGGAFIAVGGWNVKRHQENPIKEASETDGSGQPAGGHYSYYSLGVRPTREGGGCITIITKSIIAN